MSDTFGTRNAGQSLEERLEIQALSADLREAVMACLCGGVPPVDGWGTGRAV